MKVTIPPIILKPDVGPDPFEIEVRDLLFPDPIGKRYLDIQTDSFGNKYLKDAFSINFQVSKGITLSLPAALKVIKAQVESKLPEIANLERLKRLSLDYRLGGYEALKIGSVRLLNARNDSTENCKTALERTFKGCTIEKVALDDFPRPDLIPGGYQWDRPRMFLFAVRITGEFDYTELYSSLKRMGVRCP